MKIMWFFKDQQLINTTNFCRKNQIKEMRPLNVVREKIDNTEIKSSKNKNYFINKTDVNLTKQHLSNNSSALNFTSSMRSIPFDKTLWKYLGLTEWGNLKLINDMGLIKCTDYSNGVARFENWNRPLNALEVDLGNDKRISGTCKALVFALGEHYSKLIPTKAFSVLINNQPGKVMSFNLLMSDKSEIALRASKPKDIARLLSEYNGFVISPLDKSITPAEEAVLYDYLFPLKSVTRFYHESLNLSELDTPTQGDIVDKDLIGRLGSFVKSTSEYNPGDFLFLTLNNNKRQIIPKIANQDGSEVKDVSIDLLTENDPLKPLIRHLNFQLEHPEKPNIQN